MKKISAIVSLLVMAGVSTAMAAQDATLNVKGKLVPNACDISLSTNTVDFGYIVDGSGGSGAHPTALKPMSMTIACGADATVLFTVTDNSGFAASGGEEFGVTSTSSSGVNAGTFLLEGDFTGLNLGTSTSAVQAGGVTPITNYQLIMADNLYGAVQMNDFTTTSGYTLPITVAFNPNMGITEEVEFEGSATFAIYYI